MLICYQSHVNNVLLRLHQCTQFVALICLFATIWTLQKAWAFWSVLLLSWTYKQCTWQASSMYYIRALNVAKHLPLSVASKYHLHEFEGLNNNSAPLEDSFSPIWRIRKHVEILLASYMYSVCDVTVKNLANWGCFNVPFASFCALKKIRSAIKNMK